MYIGQASDASQDQILEEAEMDEIQPGQMKFVFEVRETAKNDVLLDRKYF